MILQKWSFGDLQKCLKKMMGQKFWPPGGVAEFPNVFLSTNILNLKHLRNQWSDLKLILWKGSLDDLLK